MEPIVLTPAGSGDSAALMDLFCRVRGHDLGAAAWPEAIRDTTLRLQYEAQCRGYLERWPAASTMFLTRAGEHVGWIIVDRSGPALHVVDVALVPEVRGQGLGREALRPFLDEAAHAGRPVTLTVQRTNMPATKLYSRLGFQPIGGDDLHLYLERRPPAPPPMATAPQWTARIFRAALDTWFEVEPSDPPLLLALREVNEHPPSGGYTRFALIFHGPGDRLLPQGLHTLRHPIVGDHEMFLVPVVGSTADVAHYEACFSVPEVQPTA